MPLACNLATITNDQRPRYHALVQALRSALQSRDELPDGYSYKLNTGMIALPEVAEWITLERQCCPFLAFQIDVNDHGSFLTMRGPDGTKAILREEFPV